MQVLEFFDLWNLYEERKDIELDITFFSDGSGQVQDLNEDIVFEFVDFGELVNFLNS